MDHLCYATAQCCNKLDAISFHTYEDETGAIIRRWEQVLATEDMERFFGMTLHCRTKGNRR